MRFAFQGGKACGSSQATAGMGQEVAFLRRKQSSGQEVAFRLYIDFSYLFVCCVQCPTLSYPGNEHSGKHLCPRHKSTVQTASRPEWSTSFHGCLYCWVRNRGAVCSYGACKGQLCLEKSAWE